MPRFVSTTDGLGRLGPDDLVEIIDPAADGLEDLLLSGVTPEQLVDLPAYSTVELSRTSLKSPLHRPGKIWAVGFAYSDHAAEVGRDREDDYPVMFLKAPSSITGPYDDIRLPDLAPDRVDYEGEIAVVIGRTATSVDPGAAIDHILGYTGANDVSARDVQRGAYNGDLSDPSKAKSFDTFTPIGPWVSTLDTIDDPADVGLKTWVDGELRQKARSSALVNDIPTIVAFASRLTTLEPGDLILTGTPSGVGHPTGRFLADGNVVRVEVEGVGAIENRVVG